MRLFDVAQLVGDGRIHIPYAMRAALGWHASTHLYCWRQPYAETADGGRPSEGQLSISASLPNRRELWYLTVRFRDRTGMLNDVSDLLKGHQIDIVSCRASTQLQNTQFAIDMELDTSLYEGDHDATFADRKRRPARGLRELYARIVCRFFREIVFQPDGTPALSLVRNPILSGSIIADTNRYDALLEPGGDLIVSADIIESVRSAFVERYPHVQRNVGKAALPYVMLVADARWSVIDATFFYKNTGHKHVRVHARDRIGSLQEMTSELRHHGFNILQLYTRTVAGTDHAISDMLLHLVDDKSQNDAALVTYIKGVFRGRRLRDLEPEVTFPPPVAISRRRRK
jgi:predicted amino acid-binding ACT domain protein